MLIPYTELSPEALDDLIAQYITQEHGLNDIEDPVTTYHDEVRQSLVEGKLVVVYSQSSKTAWLAAFQP